MVVYKITNRLNGKIYVGQTHQSIEKRFYQHAHTNSPLGDAMRDCGLENFTIEVIEECPTQEQLNDREIFWIRVLNCRIPNGYNRSDGGSCGYGEPKRKLSKPVRSSGMTLSESLKRFRRDFNLSQKTVAEKLKMKQPLYYRYESGETVPAVTFIVKLADAFDVSTDYLLGRRDTPKPIEVGAAEVQEAREFRLALKKFVEETRI